MAERVLRIRECDRLGCRRRKDVQKVMVDIAIPAESGLRIEGELCPSHREMLIDRVEKMFLNKKKYD